MKILLLNGPPRSGKDTVAQMIKDHSSSHVHLEKFAHPIKTAVPLAYSIPLDHWRQHVDTTSNKDLPCTELFGKTPREVQIAFSEEFLKPLHDQSIFGELLARRIERINFEWFTSVVVSDSGFEEEARVIIDKYGAENVQLWRIMREGCDFKGDSRGYIDLGIRMYDIPNEGSLDDLRDLVIPLYEAFTTPRDIVKHDKKDNEPESNEDWIARQLEMAGKAFSEWPKRRIARIEQESRDG